MSFVSNLLLGSLRPSDSPGALLVRRVVPATIGLPIVLGFLRLLGERVGLYSLSVGVAIMIAFSCVGATLLLLWTARSVNRIDAERLRVVEALRQSSERHRTLLRNFPDGAIVLFDRDLRHLVADGLGLAGVGLSREQMEGKTIWEVFPHDVCAAIEPPYRAALEGEESTFEYAYSGRTFFVRVTPVRDDASGSIWAGAVMVRDITARKRTELELREASERFERIFENAPIGEAIVAPDGRWIQVNQALCELVGFSREELLSKTFQNITHPDDLDADMEFVRQMLVGEIRTYEMEKRYLHKDGRAVWVLLSVSLVQDSDGKPLHFISQVQDISQRKWARELEDQLRHSQKLEAIGQLAGGVAHEFNNMLMAISAYSDLVLDRLDNDNPLRGDVEQISRAAARSRSLTQQLLAFGRRQLLQPSVIDVNDLVASSATLLRPLLGVGIELTLDLDPQVGMIRADPAQIEQAIVNLLLNARDALDSGGRITIGSRNIEVEERIVAGEVVASGSYVVLSIADDGVGMDEETCERMFEPFFTTKASGHGSGLGLATVHGIIRQSGGFISVDTSRGVGTTVNLGLRRPEQPAANRGAPVELRTGGDAGTVLLVDDEELVRDVCEKLFEDLGWRTLTACDGLEALELVVREKNAIHLLLTDVVMPGMTGNELAETVSAVHPETIVIYMSGYTEEHGLRAGALSGTVHFLQKPFSRAELDAKVRKALDARNGKSGRSALTCVVADDHPTVLEAVRRGFEERGIHVVATSTNGDEALEEIARHRPDVALLDIAMPIGGIEAARRVPQLSPDTRLLLYTGTDSVELANEALDAGAHGVIVKDAPLSELARALEIVAGGRTYTQSPAAGPGRTRPEAAAALTARELDVLRLLAEGHTNDRAGIELSISPDTVQTHVRNAMKKLGADSRTEAVAKALRRALIA